MRCAIAISRIAATVSATPYGNYNAYDAAIGRRGSWTTGGTAQWDYQPGPKTTWNGWAGYEYTKGDVGYDYASLGAVSNTQQPFPAAIGSGFPGNYYRVHGLDPGLTASLTERLSGRLFARFETGDFADFHYSGFEDTLVYAHRVYTDRGPARDYDASMIGLMLNYRL